MPSELEMWDLYWSAGTAVGIYFAALAFLIWVSFRAANMVGETDNMIGKIAVTVFCLTIDWNILVNNAFFQWIQNSAGGVFVAMQEQGATLSPGAQTIIANSQPGLEFNLVPDLVGGLFLAAILVMQMSSIWMKK
tara:strand:+ start:1642 stop:2046 length:405 start_codon:yes stop_codon:yes gene_type:complete